MLDNVVRPRFVRGIYSWYGDEEVVVYWDDVSWVLLLIDRLFSEVKNWGSFRISFYKVWLFIDRLAKVI
jgi:hypothetical protein